MQMFRTTEVRGVRIGVPVGFEIRSPLVASPGESWKRKAVSNRKRPLIEIAGRGKSTAVVSAQPYGCWEVVIESELGHGGIDRR